MLINLRNALMTGKRLPYDAEVEFLESTGTQYIDTGIASDGVGLRADVVCEKTTASTGEAGVVGRLSLGDGFELYIASRRCGLWNGPYDRFVVSSVSIAQSTVYNISAEVTNSGASITINGTTNSASFTPISISADYIIIFNHRGRYPFVGRIYSCKIWQNGVLVRDYIPVRKGTVGYLYDRVSGKLFGNAGTGDFTCGPDVVPATWVDDEYWNALGVATALLGASRCDNFIPVQPSSTVTFYLGVRPGGTTLRMIQYNGDKARIDTAYANNGSARTVTIPANCYYIRVSCETAKKNEAYIHDNTNDRYLLRDGMVPID